MKEQVIRIVYEPVDMHEAGDEGLVKIGVFGGHKTRLSHHLTSEAPSAAVCLALEAASRQVARYEVNSGDGFALRVVFVNESGEPIKVEEKEPVTHVCEGSGQ